MSGKKRLLCGGLLLVLLVPLLFACTAEEIGDGGYDLYFQESNLNLAAGGGAFQTERVYLSAEDDPQKLAEALIAELLKGPRDETLKNTIPAGTTLQSLELTGHRGSGGFVGDLQQPIRRSADYGGLRHHLDVDADSRDSGCTDHCLGQELGISGKTGVYESGSIAVPGGGCPSDDSGDPVFSQR